MYLWLRKRLPGGQSLVSPLLLPPPAPPCAGRLNHGPKHCHVPSCTRHKLRSRSSVRGGGGGGGGALGTAGARSMGSEVICLELYERPDTTQQQSGRWGRPRARRAPRMVRYTYSTDIAIQQASDGTESNGMGMSEARTCIFNIRLRIHFVLQSGNPCRLGCRESHSVRGGGEALSTP